jgi:hypothetical protein
MPAQLAQEVEGAREPELLSQLQAQISRISASDLGLTGKVLSSCFSSGLITDTTIYESDALSLHLFGLTRDQGFPLHDHPQMVGFTVLLQGSVRYRSLSIASSEGGLLTCRQDNSSELSAPGVLVLTPNIGNIHEIYANENTLILDIFVPNYSNTRNCTFYSQVTQVGDRITLRVIAPPDINARALMYRGPRLSV